MLLRIIFISYLTSCFLVSLISADGVKISHNGNLIDTLEYNSSNRSETPITIEIKEILPYSANELICVVTAEIPVIIGWLDGEGTELDSEKQYISSNVTVSRITVNNRVSNTYSCYATDLIAWDDTRRSVSVITPFVVHQSPKEITELFYGDPGNITCDVKSIYPLIWRWYFLGQDGVETPIPIDGVENYIVSPDGTTLFIRSMDNDMVGNYTCEAALRANEFEKISYTTRVELGSFYPIVTIHSDPTVVVKDGEKLSIACSATGVPKPFITWMAYYDNADDEIVIGDGITTILQNKHMDKTKSGARFCIATNTLGTDVGVINVNVE